VHTEAVDLIVEVRVVVVAFAAGVLAFFVHDKANTVDLFLPNWHAEYAVVAVAAVLHYCVPRHGTIHYWQCCRNLEIGRVLWSEDHAWESPAGTRK
jgi:hypothetical protein